MHEKQYEDEYLYIIAYRCDRKSERVKIISEEAVIFSAWDDEFSYRCNFNSLVLDAGLLEGQRPINKSLFGQFSPGPIIV